MDALSSLGFCVIMRAEPFSNSVSGLTDLTFLKGSRSPMFKALRVVNLMATSSRLEQVQEQENSSSMMNLLLRRTLYDYICSSPLFGLSGACVLGIRVRYRSHSFDTFLVPRKGENSCHGKRKRQRR